jgi:ribosomal protein S18 acetylase RimI-like enzyme
MHIRPATLSDAPSITALGKMLLSCHSEFDPAYYMLEDNFDELFTQWVYDQLKFPSQFILIAESDEKKVIGFISGFIKSLYPWFKTKQVGHIAYLAVDIAHQKKGVGTALEKEAVIWFQTKGVGYIEVYTDTANEVGKKAWTKYRYSDFKKFLRKKLSP